uniref:(California timema) hypothetical protein n=1 Tax=Timema californicum TaxID=61474 RepID=A0A7R9J213_TIMCA|nr:unnamed protein product [Timema californicum]
MQLLIVLFLATPLAFALPSERRVRAAAPPGVNVNDYVNAILNRVKFEADDSPMDASVPDISHIFEQEGQVLDLEINNGHVSALENIDLQGEVNLVSNEGHTITFDINVRLAVGPVVQMFLRATTHTIVQQCSICSGLYCLNRYCFAGGSRRSRLTFCELMKPVSHEREWRAPITIPCGYQVRTSSGEVLHSGEVDTEVDGVGATVIVSVFLDTLGNFHSQLEGIVLNSQNGIMEMEGEGLYVGSDSVCVELLIRAIVHCDGSTIAVRPKVSWCSV